MSISVEVPPLNLLYLHNEDEDDDRLVDIKWKILGWIMSLSTDVIAAMKKLPTDLFNTSVTLYALVKVYFDENAYRYFI